MAGCTHACVVGGGSPGNFWRTQGYRAVVIVVLYWAPSLPQFAEWREQIELALHTAVMAVTVAYVFAVAAGSRRFGSSVLCGIGKTGRAVGSTARRIHTWFKTRVEINIRLQARLGVS